MRACHGASARERAGRIRREHGTRLPDAPVTATAIEHRLSVMTRVEDLTGIGQVRPEPVA